MSSTTAYEVVMATWNGADHLDQQFASILGQSCLPVRVLVADDGSSDATLTLVEAWQRRSSVPVELLPARPQRLGSCASFERLLAASRAPYVMPADQDDIWDTDKAVRLLTAMGELERHWGSATPLLVHGDLRLIDHQERPLAPSFHRFQGLQPQRSTWLAIALQNVVTGCSSLVNRACIAQALPFPPEAVLHDWWLALVAARQGHIAFLPEACVSYRQHGANAVGAIGGQRQLLKRLRQALDAGAVQRLLGPGLDQLQACTQRFPDGLTAQQNRWLAQLRHPLPLRRWRAAQALGLRKHGVWRTAGFYAALGFWSPAAPGGG